MLWSLIKIVFFIALITALAFGAAFLIETGGEVRLSFGGTEYTFEPLVALIGLVLLMLAICLSRGVAYPKRLKGYNGSAVRFQHLIW